METKTCKLCGIVKELSSFYTHFDKRRNKGYTFANCRSCAIKRDKEWKRQNPRRAREIALKSQHKNWPKHYQTFLEKKKSDWIGHSRQRKIWERNKKKPRNQLIEKLLDTQNVTCAICKKPFENKKFDVDHSHTTGLIRGLLCRKCNSGLHYFEDKDFIDKATKYVLAHPALDFSPVKY